MTTLKTLGSTEDLFLYLSFHSLDEANINRDFAHVDRLMNDEFSDNQEKMFESREDREVVYKLTKPIFVSSNEMESFFQKLKIVFNAAASMQPHFTQFQESDKV